MPRISTIVLYYGELPVPLPLSRRDCWQFYSVKEAATWLHQRGVADTVQHAEYGLRNVIQGHQAHYRGYTVSLAYA